MNDNLGIVIESHFALKGPDGKLHTCSESWFLEPPVFCFWYRDQAQLYAECLRPRHTVVGLTAEQVGSLPLLVVRTAKGPFSYILFGGKPELECVGTMNVGLRPEVMAKEQVIQAFTAEVQRRYPGAPTTRP